MTLREYFDGGRGRLIAMAKELGVSSQFMTQVTGGKRPCPISYVLRIEDMTGGQVTRQELRPCDWHLIWPAKTPRKTKNAQ